MRWILQHCRRWERNTPIVMKLTMTIIVVTAISVAISTGLAYDTARRVLLENTIHDMEHLSSRQVNRFQNTLDALRRDLIQVSRMDAIQGIIAARAAGGIDPDQGLSEEEWRLRLVRRLMNMSSVQGYQQIRLLGFEDGGREIVRVNGSRDNDLGPRVVPDLDLQRKGDRPYMLAGRKLRAGQIHVSGIDLNREEGRIEDPWRPTLRLITPVFASGAEDPFGAVAINVDAALFLEFLAQGDRFESTVYNSTGGVILHPESSGVWGFEFNREDDPVDMDVDAIDMLRAGREPGSCSSDHGTDQHIHWVERIPPGSR
jgi:hypothetical protein